MWMYVGMYVCIYIYYLYIHLYIYIFIYLFFYRLCAVNSVNSFRVHVFLKVPRDRDPEMHRHGVGSRLILSKFPKY